jgi:NTP pyrophosphatase (non-canonical NTP hydrolase)
MSDFNMYQERAWNYALPNAKDDYYLLTGIQGEVGELSSLFAKAYRDEKELPVENIKKELGDILWFVASMAYYWGWTLGDVAQTNLDKLESRKQRGTLSGSGDER